MSLTKRYLARRQQQLKANIWRYTKLIVQLCAFLVVLAGTYYTYNIIQDREFLKIKQVILTGEYQHIQKNDLHKTIAPFLYDNFFTIDLQGLREQLLYYPWIKAVHLKRIWPSSLAVEVSEYQPIAIWDNIGLLDNEGILFNPDVIPSELITLPHFTGEHGRHIDMLNQYNVWLQQLRRLNLTIDRVILTNDNNWFITLSNHITLRLGSESMNERVKRFVNNYQQLIENEVDKIDYVDLRYANGMSIGWK